MPKIKKPSRYKVIIIVHAAIDRKALCKFDLKDPNDWPAGHRWVKAKDPKYGKRVTCKPCLKKLK